jgi:heterodisulfide reductase subunit C2
VVYSSQGWDPEDRSFVFEGLGKLSRAEISKQTLQSAFVRKTEEISGQQVARCNQCGKCSAGCPASSAMDLMPNQIIRLVQLGIEQDISNSSTIWLCASCLTCSTRCPRGIDLARLMEALRLLSLRRNVDRITLANIPTDVVAELPQIALVSGLRKLTA